jgi:predicted MarR family transcription regulator
MSVEARSRSAAPKRRPSPRREGNGAFAPSAASRALSDFEFALIILTFGFSRWVESCMGAAAIRGLGALDILVLHAVNHRARARRLSEICTVLNIDDSHLVSYALKKLIAGGLVQVERKGRERHYETTDKGDGACLSYREVRERFLVDSLSWMANGNDELPRSAGFLRTMTAIYDQAGRFATASSLSHPHVPPVRTKR